MLSKPDQEIFEDNNSAEAKHIHEMLGKKLGIFAEEVSIIGVRHAFDTSSSGSRKCVWMVLVLLGIVLATYQIEDRVAAYMSFPTSVGINIVQASSLRFPQITFCNDNTVRKSVAEDFGR